jgi:hypothetical protein
VDAFGGQNLEVPPYPSTKVVLTRFGTVSVCADRQGLCFAPFMVELFTAGLLSRTPSVVIRPVACVAADKLPTTAEVERALQPEPPGGIKPAHAGVTHLRTTAARWGQSVPVAQTPENL